MLLIFTNLEMLTKTLLFAQKLYTSTDIITSDYCSFVLVKLYSMRMIITYMVETNLGQTKTSHYIED